MSAIDNIVSVAMKAAPIVIELFKGLGATEEEAHELLRRMKAEPPRAVDVDRVALAAIASGTARETLPPANFPPIVLDSADKFLDGFHGTEAEAVELADAMSTRARERLAAAMRRDDI